MTTEASPSEGGAPRRVAYATNIYVGVVAAVGLCLTAAAIRVDGISRRRHLLASLLLLAVLSWWLGSVETEGGRTQPVVHRHRHARGHGPRGPRRRRHRGHDHGSVRQQGRAPLRARIFNTGMFATMGVVGGAAYVVAGGRPRRGPARRGTWQIALQIGIPLLVADVVQFAVNLVLLAIVVRLAAGVSMRTQVGQIVALLRLRPDRLRRHRLHHGRALGAGGPRARPACSSSSRRCSPPSGPTGSTPRSSRATTGPFTCWWPRSRPRLRTWPATAPASPS